MWSVSPDSMTSPSSHSPAVYMQTSTLFAFCFQFLYWPLKSIAPCNKSMLLKVNVVLKLKSMQQRLVTLVQDITSTFNCSELCVTLTLLSIIGLQCMFRVPFLSSPHALHTRNPKVIHHFPDCCRHTTFKVLCYEQCYRNDFLGESINVKIFTSLGNSKNLEI